MLKSVRLRLEFVAHSIDRLLRCCSTAQNGYYTYGHPIFGFFHHTVLKSNAWLGQRGYKFPKNSKNSSKSCSKILIRIKIFHSIKMFGAFYGLNLTIFKEGDHSIVRITSRVSFSYIWTDNTFSIKVFKIVRFISELFIWYPPFWSPFMTPRVAGGNGSDVIRTFWNIPELVQ